MGHPPRIPVWLQWDQSVVYFVTFCVADHAKVLDNEQTFRAFKSAVSRLRGWSVIAAILMPDHVHLLVAPTEDREAKLGNLVGALKRWTRQALNARWQWQPGSFDRLLRRDESTYEKWLYVEENPVRAGLVSQSQDWPYRIGFDEPQETGKL
jgi:REP element-mobilizing transposase RayT